MFFVIILSYTKSFFLHYLFPQRFIYTTLCFYFWLIFLNLGYLPKKDNNKKPEPSDRLKYKSQRVNPRKEISSPKQIASFRFFYDDVDKMTRSAIFRLYSKSMITHWMLSFWLLIYYKRYMSNSKTIAEPTVVISFRLRLFSS